MKIRWFPLVAGLAIVVLGHQGGDSIALGQTTLAGRIAYNCGDICVVDLTTGVNTDLAVVGTNPKFSPDGTRIVFDGSGGINVMNADGTNQKLLWSGDSSVPSWSPDSSQIAFCVRSKGRTSNNGIWVMNADGSAARRLTTFGCWPAWSPGLGTQIAFSYSNTQIWLMDVATPSNAHQVAACSDPGGKIDVVWSPGPLILFGDSVKGPNSYELFTCNPNATGGVGSGLTRLTTSLGSDFEPSWSPNGTMIAWYSGRSPAGIWEMNATAPFLPQPLFPGRQPSWGR